MYKIEKQQIIRKSKKFRFRQTKKQQLNRSPTRQQLSIASQQQVGNKVEVENYKIMNKFNVTLALYKHNRIF